MPLHSHRNVAKYTDIVRLVNVKHQEDIELGEHEKLIRMKLHVEYDVMHCSQHGSWVVLHVRKYLYNDGAIKP